MTLLVDGDIALYTACAAVEKEIQWDPENHILFSNEMEAITAFQHIITSYCDALDDDVVKIAFSGHKVFRHELFPDYKAGRSRKPMCYGQVKVWALE